MKRFRWTIFFTIILGTTSAVLYAQYGGTAGWYMMACLVILFVIFLCEL